MNTKIIAEQYLKHLENADMNKVVALFADNGVVGSPIYSTQPAKDFYEALSNDTTSTFNFKGIFEQANPNKFALVFHL